MPLFNSWAEVASMAISLITIFIAIFAKSALERLQATLITNKINPKLVSNIENSLDSAREMFSENLVLEDDCFRYFHRVCENVLDLNRRNRRSYIVSGRVRVFKISMYFANRSPHRGRRVLAVWQSFDLYVEGWKTHFANEEEIRKARNRYGA